MDTSINRSVETPEKMAALSATYPKTPVPVLTAKSAEQDLMQKENYLVQNEQAVQRQKEQVQQLNTQAQLDAERKAKEQQDLLLRQQEIDAKNKLLQNEEQLQEEIEPRQKTQNYLIEQYQQMVSQQDQNYQKMISDLESVRSGTFPLSPADEAAIKSVELRFEQLKRAQEVANKNYEQGIKQLGVTSGRARYAGEIEMGNVQQAINLGIQKISDIEAAASEAITNLRMAFQQRDYDMIKDSYQMLSDSLKEKTSILNEMRTAINEEAERQMEELKARQEQLKYEDELQKSTIGNIASIAYRSLTGDEAVDAKLISDLAGMYGVDPNFLLNAVYEKEQAIKKENTASGDVGQYLSAIDAGIVDPNTTSLYDFIRAQKQASTEDKVLSIKDAQELGVPYGTTESQARAMGINLGTTDYGMVSQGVQTTLTAIKDAEKFANAAGRSKIKEGIAQWFFGATDATKLQAYTNTIKTNLLALASDPDIKKFFGPQMSNADVKMMMAIATSLDPELQGPVEYKKSLAEAKALIEKFDTSKIEGGDEIDDWLQSFSSPLSMGINGSEVKKLSSLDPKKSYEAKTLIGDAVITGIQGSKYWKQGLDIVFKNPTYTIPLNGIVEKVVSGYSNQTGKPLPVQSGKKQNKGFGNQVVVRLNDGTRLMFSHLSDVGNAKPGVPARQVKITQGNTGLTYGNTGKHTDITGIKPDGTYLTAPEVAALLKVTV